MANRQQINVSDYLDKKEKGLIALAKIGNAYAMSVAQFDSNTGEAIDPQIVGISLAQLEEQRESRLKDVADIDNMITDLKSLDNK